MLPSDSGDESKSPATIAQTLAVRVRPLCPLVGLESLRQGQSSLGRWRELHFLGLVAISAQMSVIPTTRATGMRRIHTVLSGRESGVTIPSTLAPAWSWVSTFRPPLLNVLLGYMHYLCALPLTSVPKPQWEVLH